MKIKILIDILLTIVRSMSCKRGLIMPESALNRIMPFMKGTDNTQYFGCGIIG